MKTNRWTDAGVVLGMAAILAVPVSALAQVPVDQEGNPVGEASPLDNGVTIENPTRAQTTLTAAELETLVGPIALYPDDLLAIVLPASTYPLEIVQAARFLEALEADPDLKPDEAWDDSIVALLNYPDVLRMMNEEIDWTWSLGEAVVDQQPDVIGAIESFRDRAYAAGNLKTDDHQTVTMDDGVIEIEPVSDDVIYVPYYEPEQVVTVSPVPVYHYYPDPYPVYYYPYSYRRHYHSRPFWGVTTAFTIGWATDRLHVYHHSYRGHPYYGYSYIGNYWRRPSINIYNSYYVDRYRYRPSNRYRVGDYWRPRHRSVPRPRNRTVRNYYAGQRDDHRGNLRETRTYRDRNRNRFSDTISNATRGRQSTDARLNRRAVNRGDASQRSRPGTGQRDRAERRTQSTDGIRFRPRGDGRYTASRAAREQRVRNRREQQPVRNRPAAAARNSTNTVRANNGTRLIAADRTQRGSNRAQRRTTTRSAAANTRRTEARATNRAQRASNRAQRRSTTRNTAANTRRTEARTSIRRPAAAPNARAPRNNAARSQARPRTRTTAPRANVSRKPARTVNRAERPRQSAARSTPRRESNKARTSSRGERRRQRNR